MKNKYVFDFSEGGILQLDLLGGKGANLAEMTRLGLPVPPGFTITTEACREYLATGEAPPRCASRSPWRCAGSRTPLAAGSAMYTTRCL